MLFYGSVIASANFSQPTNNVTLVGDVFSVKKDIHTLSFKIADQTSSPNTYETIGVLVETLDGASYSLSDQKKSLLTGESISYTVELR